MAVILGDPLQNPGEIFDLINTESSKKRKFNYICVTGHKKASE
jgi:hypothetical protein